MRRKLVALILALVSAVSLGYAAYQFHAQKDELTIQAADLFARLALPYRIVRLSADEPDAELLIPVHGVRKAAIADTWNEPRAGGRVHEGVDIFAARGTPVFSATEGYVLRAGDSGLGGIHVFVVGRGGVRYYYAHLDSVAEGIEPGARVTADTVLGFVGNTGNAEGTPPHLHFGMYKDGPQNPYPLLVSRELLD